MNNIKKTAFMILLILATFFGALEIYNSYHSEVIIDYVAFFGGIFIAVEAVYRIIKSKSPIWPGQATRVLRAMIGTCIFTIPTLQFMR
jgi:hypothetical protein